jgi:hypothetical protein
MSNASLQVGFTLSLVNKSLLSMTGNSSYIRATNLTVTSGALTGSGSINATWLTCTGLCEIDVFTWMSPTASFVNKTGTLNITGDVFFQAAKSRTLYELAHSVLALGAYDFKETKSYSKLTVDGRIFVESMTISYVFLSRSCLFCLLTSVHSDSCFIRTCHHSVLPSRRDPSLPLEESFL